MLKFTVAQLNYTVSDIEGNARKMIATAQQAAMEGSELASTRSHRSPATTPGTCLKSPCSRLALLKACSRRSRPRGSCKPSQHKGGLVGCQKDAISD